jgi:Family of unknown function (DUF6659)
LASSSNQFTELCDDIFALSPKIRFVGIINRMGKLVAGGMRQGINPLENKADSSRLFLGFALRSEMKKDFDVEFGKTIYSFSERDRIKLASFPLNNHILRISMEKEEQHPTLIENILKMISALHIQS